MRRLLLVPKTGLEPVRMLLRGILSPLRLPIPPHQHTLGALRLFSGAQKHVHVLRSVVGIMRQSEGLCT